MLTRRAKAYSSSGSC